MFSWICPQCGSDVPPSQRECPHCAERAQAAAAAPAPVPGPAVVVPVATQPAPYPPPYPAPPHAQTYPPQAAPYPAQQVPYAWQPPQRKPLPTWVMGLGFAVVFIALGSGVYFGIQHFGASAAQKAGIENPANPSKQKVTNPFQKYIEVVGVRTISQNKEPVVRFVVVNHSSIEIADLAGTVTLWASTSHSDEDPVGTFRFTLPSLGPYDAKDLTAPLKTKMKMFELPDWQNANAEIQITSPPAP